ncbi:MAG: RNA 2',3'-cyclic phosphodiesterase [Candidatus Aenigmatarchaeota archaeon]
MVRCFIGYILPQDIKTKIAELQKKIETWPLKCKFVEKENLHICFSFLGEIKEMEIEKISEKIDIISRKNRKVEAIINGLIAIPNPNYIRVIALKIVESNSLKQIFSDIVKEIGGDSKPAHITLCRVKYVENKNELRRKIEEENKEHGTLKIEAIQLIKSELKRSGPVYSIIHQAELS